MWIRNNPFVLKLFPLGQALQPPPQVAALPRPVLSLSLALNYALCGFHVVCWHLVNIAIHIGAALLFFAVLRRSLLAPRFASRWRGRAEWAAGAAALLWAVHPLQTESVTYIIQRSESLAGLLLFAAVYASARRLDKPKAIFWPAAAVLSAFLAVGVKASAAVLPLVVLLHEAVFITGSVREALKKSRSFYMALASSWLLLGWLLSLKQDPSAGFGLSGLTAAQYASTQPGVVLHYLRLLFWPDPLCLDYQWQPVAGISEMLAPLSVLAALMGAVFWFSRGRRELKFWLGWFLLTLVPTSSVIPIADLAFEHRMYVPSAGAIAFLVLTWSANRGDATISSALTGPRRSAMVLIVVVLALVLSGVTAARNWTYRSEASVWADVAAKQPGSARAHNNLGLGLAREGRMEEAAAEFRQAIRLDPAYVNAYNNLGLALSRLGNNGEAIAQFEAALKLDTRSASARNNLGLVFARQGRFEEAERQLVEALEIEPTHAGARENLEWVRAELRTRGGAS